MILAKRNYKVYADTGLNKNLLTRKVCVLDTGAGPNFIRKSDLPEDYFKYVRQGPLPYVTDANRNPIRMLGTIDLVIQLGRWVAKCEFIVYEKLAAQVILGC